jgi:hypothetical protein
MSPVLAEGVSDEDYALFDGDNIDKGQIVALLFSRMQDLNMDDWIKDTLGKVYREGSSTPVDIDEEWDNPSLVIKVVSEVLLANFMIQSCLDLFSLTPQLLQATALQQNLEPSATI